MGKYFIFILLFLYTGPAFGQWLDSTINASISKLREQKVDTIIRLGLLNFHDPIKDTLAGFRIVDPFEVQYLVYKIGNKAYSRKYVAYCCDSIGLAISREYQIANDSLFFWIHSRFDLIKKEQVYPYIYLQKENGNLDYVPFQTSHPADYLLGIYTTNQNVSKQVNPDDLLKNVRGFPDNLNYANNYKTTLREFYLLLVDYFTRIDKGFVF